MANLPHSGRIDGGKENRQGPQAPRGPRTLEAATGRTPDLREKVWWVIHHPAKKAGLQENLQAGFVNAGAQKLESKSVLSPVFCAPLAQRLARLQEDRTLVAPAGAFRDF